MVKGGSPLQMQREKTLSTGEQGNVPQVQRALTREEQSRLLDILLEIGYQLLGCGGEVSRVEDTLTRVGKAYGAQRVEVFVITSIISMTLAFPDAEPITETRRIHAGGGSDFYKMEKLNALSRQCCANPLPLPELRDKIDHIAAGHKPFYSVFWGSVLVGGAFSMFFGGSVWDGLTAAVIGALVCLLQERLGRTALNTVAFNLLVSLLMGLGVGLTTALIPGLHMDMILMGDIMLLIPGLAITNAVRNMLVGDTISGVVRLLESLIWAAALAGGIMVALIIVGMLR